MSARFVRAGPGADIPQNSLIELEANQDDAYFEAVTDVISVSPNTAYIADGWFKLGPEGGNDCVALLQARSAQSQGDYGIGTSENTQLTSSYQDVVLSFNTGSYSLIVIQFGIICSATGGDGANGYIDDIVARAS